MGATNSKCKSNTNADDNRKLVGNTGGRQQQQHAKQHADPGGGGGSKSNNSKRGGDIIISSSSCSDSARDSSGRPVAQQGERDAGACADDEEHTPMTKERKYPVERRGLQPVGSDAPSPNSAAVRKPTKEVGPSSHRDPSMTLHTTKSATSGTTSLVRPEPKEQRPTPELTATSMLTDKDPEDEIGERRQQLQHYARANYWPCVARMTMFDGIGEDDSVIFAVFPACTGGNTHDLLKAKAANPCCLQSPRRNQKRTLKLENGNANYNARPTPVEPFDSSSGTATSTDAPSELLHDPDEDQQPYTIFHLRDRDWSVTPQGLPFAAVLTICFELYCALLNLHRDGISHNNVDPSSIFLDSRGHVVLSDLGLSSDLGKPLPEHTRAILKARGVPETALDNPASLDLYLFGRTLNTLTLGYCSKESENVIDTRKEGTVGDSHLGTPPSSAQTSFSSVLRAPAINDWPTFELSGRDLEHSSILRSIRRFRTLLKTCTSAPSLNLTFESVQFHEFFCDPCAMRIAGMDDDLLRRLVAAGPASYKERIFDDFAEGRRFRMVDSLVPELGKTNKRSSASSSGDNKEEEQQEEQGFDEGVPALSDDDAVQEQMSANALHEGAEQRYASAIFRQDDDDQPECVAKHRTIFSAQEWVHVPDKEHCATAIREVDADGEFDVPPSSERDVSCFGPDVVTMLEILKRQAPQPRHLIEGRCIGDPLQEWFAAAVAAIDKTFCSNDDPSYSWIGVRSDLLRLQQAVAHPPPANISGRTSPSIPSSWCPSGDDDDACAEDAAATPSSNGDAAALFTPHKAKSSSTASTTTASSSSDHQLQDYGNLLRRVNDSECPFKVLILIVQETEKKLGLTA